MDHKSICQWGLIIILGCFYRVLQETVLCPSLFNIIFINDLKIKIKSMLIKFSDDIHIARMVDRVVIQALWST